MEFYRPLLTSGHLEPRLQVLIYSTHLRVTARRKQTQTPSGTETHSVTSKHLCHK